MAVIHPEPHELAGKTVTLNEHAIDQARGMVVAGAEFRIEDYWDRVSGQSWGDSIGNPAALMYAMRTGLSSIKEGKSVPYDDEVVYGKINGFGHLVHVSELGAVVVKDESENVA